MFPYKPRTSSLLPPSSFLMTLKHWTIEGVLWVKNEVFKDRRYLSFLVFIL
jgi:hypothetical protein